MAIAGVAALTATVSPVVAGPIYKVSGPNVSEPFDGMFQNGYDTVDITKPVSESGLAGQLTIQLTDAATGVMTTVQAYCTDIFDWLKLPNSFTRGLLSDTVTDATKLSQINALYAHGNAGVMSADASAGLQMAIWEIENETGTTVNYDVTAGAFVASASSTVLAQAKQDISNVVNGIWAADPRLTIYQITGLDPLTGLNNQSLSYAVAVPEPGTLAIFGTGLVLLIVLRRVRRSPSVGTGGVVG